MTATEQLALWADASDNILVGVTYDDKPYVVQQIKASEAIVGFARQTALINVARVAELNGVTCIVVEGRFPEAGPSYRAILSLADTFK
jgi:hypothetical protein